MVHEIRIALQTAVYDELVRFFHDALGLEFGAAWRDHGRGQTFAVASATIEVLDEEHASFVEGVETGRTSHAAIRLAIRVDDVAEAVSRAERAGARVIGAPRQTPWGDRNARIEAPGGIELTLFQGA